MQNMTQEEVEKNRESLLQYCCLDTYEMVKIWDKLREIRWHQITYGVL